MHDYSFYSAILGLSTNWRILNVTLDERSGDIELYIRSSEGIQFSCPACGAARLPSGVSKARWLHENSFSFRFYISALIPVISCERCGEMKVDIPWEQTCAPCDECGGIDSRESGESPRPHVY